MTRKAEPRSVSNVDIVTYALAELGGAERAVHLEAIAVRAHALAPGAFRWDLDEYADYIDKDKVRVSLTDAEKTDKGGLVKGVGVTKSGKSKRTDLWRLSSDGAVWMIKQRDRIADALGGPTPGLKKGRASAIRRRLVASPLYEQYQRGGNVEHDPYAFTDLLECSPDAANSVVQQRFDELEAQTRLLDEPELVEFVEACALAHPDMLGRSQAQ